MATVSRENIGLLNDKITVTLSKEDYFPAFEQQIKNYAKKANIPGFRKGMVPSGMIKKMYGASVFTEEIFKTVEKELNDFMSKEQLDIFAQPLPLANDARQLDMNNPADYTFAFEIGLKPEIDINLSGVTFTNNKVEVTEEMINEEIERIKIRQGKVTDKETVESEEDILSLQFTEVDPEGNPIEGGVIKETPFKLKVFAESFREQLSGKQKDHVIVVQLGQVIDPKERDSVFGGLGLDKDDASVSDKYFKITISKVGSLELPEMNEDLFQAVYPGKNLSTQEQFYEAVKANLQEGWDVQSRNQLHDQIYHHLIDHTNIEFPEGFLKRWMQNGGEKPKTPEEAEKEYPTFVNSLKWTLISNQLINQNGIKVEQNEVHDHARQQILGYMGMQDVDEAPWMNSYVESMLKDKKFVENTYYQLQTGKLFNLLERQVVLNENTVTPEALTAMQHHHSH